MAKPYSHSWVTQRMANRLPLWANARLLRSSWLQQYLNSIGIVYEDLYKSLAIESRNNYASMANLDEVDVVYKVQLPRNFNFSIDDHDPANPITIPPITTTTINNVSTPIPICENNDIKSFWYDSFPTRLQLAGDMTSVSNQVLPPTQLKNLALATINTFPLEGRIAITIKNATDFINLKRVIQRGFVRIEGVTRKGTNDVEILSFITNTTLISTVEWRRINKISTHGIFPLIADLSVDVFSFNVTEEIDPFNLYIDEVNEMVLFTGVVFDGYNSILQHKVLAANNINLLQQGFTGFDVREQVTLLDGNYNPIPGVDFALQPFQDKIFILSHDKLYIYFNKIPHSDYRVLDGITEDVFVLAETDRRNYLKNQTVKINTDRQFPIKRVIKNRWTLTKPDGTRVRLGLDGTEWSLDQSGWILNGLSNTLQFTKQTIKYTPIIYGTYTIQLDVFYHDGETQIHKCTFDINALIPDAVLDLPLQVQNAHGLAFDSDQNLWIKKDDTAYKMRFFTDNMLVDFEKKIIYFHENYDKVIISTGA